MKSIVITFFLIMCQLVSSQTLNVATYNIRFDNPKDTPDTWVNRYKHVTGVVNLYDFDVFGTQEGLHHQLDDLKKELDGFKYIGVGRIDGDKQGEFSAIFYKKDKFKLMDQGNFWLSPNSQSPNKGWDAALERICTWGKFKVNEGGFEFYLFNVHFDHMGVAARKESVLLMLKMIHQIAGDNPVLFMGDFNFDEFNENFQLLKKESDLKDTFDKAKFKYAPSGTFNSFGKSPVGKGRIDHIFVSKHFKVERYGVLTNSYNGRYPSDHFPVMSVVKYNIK